MIDVTKAIAISIATYTLMSLVVLAVVFILKNSYRLRPGYHWDTLKIRCEQERGGILIGKTCFKKEAIHWSEKDT